MKKQTLLSFVACAFFVFTTSCQEFLEEWAKGGDKPPRENPANFQAVGQIMLGGEGAAEISAYDPSTERLFVVSNDDDSRVDVVDLHDPTNPTLIETIDIAPYGGGGNSVAVNDGLLAVAVEADPAQEPGSVVFFATESLEEVRQVTVGALPDMVTFSPDGATCCRPTKANPRTTTR